MDLTDIRLGHALFQFFSAGFSAREPVKMHSGPPNPTSYGSPLPHPPSEESYKVVTAFLELGIEQPFLT